MMVAWARTAAMTAACRVRGRVGQRAPQFDHQVGDVGLEGLGDHGEAAAAAVVGSGGADVAAAGLFAAGGVEAVAAASAA